MIMDLALMEQILKEILREQKELAVENQRVREDRQQVFSKLENIDKKLDTLKTSPAIDQSSLLPSIKKSLEEVKMTIETQPKTLVHQKSFQLFPNRPEEYYRIIFGGIFKGLVILIVGIYALVIIDRYIKEKEYLHYKQAWQKLYSRQKEDSKQFLDKVWKDSEKAEGIIMEPQAR